MWTVFFAKLETAKVDSSDPKDDVNNFKNLIKDLNDKLIMIQKGDKTCRFHIDSLGSLCIVDENDTSITFSEKGTINVAHPAA